MDLTATSLQWRSFTSKSPQPKTRRMSLREYRALLMGLERCNQPILSEQSKQWADVVNWSVAIESAISQSDSVSALKEIYTRIQGLQPNIERGEHLALTSEAPLLTLLYCIDAGKYPPPELLLAIADSLRKYMQAGGDKELEDVFFGRSRPKAGNFAQRMKTSLRSAKRRYGIRHAFKKQVINGERPSLARAAESALDQDEKVDLDSVLRVNRGIGADIQALIGTKGLERRKAAEQLKLQRLAVIREESGLPPKPRRKPAAGIRGGK